MSPSTRLALACLLPLATSVAVGCDSSESFVPSPCDVTLHALAPTEALPSERIVASGRPFTTAYDTAVYVGATRATVEDVAREDCDACDECLDEQSCTGCDDCDACDPVCTSCLETVTFTVPPVAPGESTVRLFNRHGESNALPLLVLGPATDTGDTGPTDTGTDTNAQDTGADDTGTDSTLTDTGPSGTDTATGSDTGATAVDTASGES